MAEMLGYVALFATATLFGSMLFFTAVMAPLIFNKLGPDRAGGFIRQVLPWYYLVIIGLGAVATLALAIPRSFDAAMAAGVTAAAVAARQVLMPTINRARDAMLAGDATAELQFSRRHRMSVWINAAQIIAIGIVLARFV